MLTRNIDANEEIKARILKMLEMLSISFLDQTKCGFFYVFSV